MGTHGDEAVEEVAVQCVEAGVIGLQRGGESMLGGQEIDEEGYPSPECLVGGCAVYRHQGGTGLGAGLDLVPVDGDDQIGSRREVAVDRAHPDAGPSRDIAHGHIDAGRDEERGGGGEQRLLVTPGVGPLPRGRRPWSAVDVDHCAATSITPLNKRSIAPYSG